MRDARYGIRDAGSASFPLCSSAPLPLRPEPVSQPRELGESPAPPVESRYTRPVGPAIVLPRQRVVARRGLVVLAVVVLLAEAAFVVVAVRQRGLFEYVALDYRGSRTAGEAIREHGLAAAYDLAGLEAAQRQLYDRFVRVEGRGVMPFALVPAPYPAPFTLLFVPSTLLPPVAGFLAWTLLHAAVLVLYQLRLARAFGLARPGWLIAAVLLSPPALVHLLMGQLSVWPMVFAGEALIAFTRGRQLSAGAWLGLAVLKPQSLVLFVPGLALARQWRVLAGMAMAVAVLAAATLAADPGWIAGYSRHLLPFFAAEGQVMASFPTSMCNWRAFGLNAARILPAGLAWVLACAGMAATGAAGLACARRLAGPGRRRAGVAWLGLTAAGCAFTWHAHVHMSLLLAPPLYLVLAERPALRPAVEVLCLGLAAVFLGAASVGGVGRAHDLLGLAMLGVLVACTAACFVELRRPSPATA